MSKFPDEIGLRCPICGEITTFERMKVFDKEADYICTKCGKVVTIGEGVSRNIFKRRIFNIMSEIYTYIIDAGSKIIDARSTASVELKDEELIREFDKVARCLREAEDKVKEKMKKL